MSLCRRPIRRIALAAKTGSFINKTIRASFSQQNIYTQLEPTQFTHQEPQLIGEERRNDVILKIYLKRVRHKSAVSSLNRSSSSVVHPTKADNDDERQPTGEARTPDQGTLLYSTVKLYQLKAGTLEKIVEYLTSDAGELDTVHMHILFSTYRTFTNTRTLIDAIIARYQAVLPASLDMTEDVRRKTLKSLRMAITCLLNTYKEDFCESPCYATLSHLISNLPDEEIRKQGQSLLEQFRHDEDHPASELDDNNNHSKKNCLADPQGFDYLLPWNVLEISSTVIAEQLTIVDADLLKRMLPYECLTISSSGCSRRASPNHSNPALSTVEKTIEFFNEVVGRVIATILKQNDEQTRANVIEKWIDVAHQCRKLKNFSSLTAILNGLLSGCIYRLSMAWSYVTEDYWSILNELKNVFGSCADRQQARAILDKQLDEVRLALPECTEGTAKHVDINTAINATLGKRSRHKASRDQPKPAMVGTVPYLGMYLSDLTYIDSAYPNTINNENKNDSSASNSTEKLINFEKHRKQFEVLAQIKLFQSAANAYTTLHSLPRFKAWFNSVRIYNDTESWDLSYHIEPKETADSGQHQEQFVKTYRSQPLRALTPQFPSPVSLELWSPTNTPTSSHTDSTVLGNGSLRSSPSATSLDKMSIASNSSLHQSKTIQTPRPNHSRSSSVSSALTSSNGSSSQGYGSAATSPTIHASSTFSTSDENDSVIAKVHFAGKDDLLYKKVRIKNDERTTTVLKTILDKFGFDPSTYDRYCIEQRLPGRKILILDHCNVFYALARSSDDEQVELIVREKTRQEREQKCIGLPPGAGHNRTPSGLSITSTQSR